MTSRSSVLCRIILPIVLIHGAASASAGQPGSASRVTSIGFPRVRYSNGYLINTIPLSRSAQEPNVVLRKEKGNIHYIKIWPQGAQQVWITSASVDKDSVLVSGQFLSSNGSRERFLTTTNLDGGILTYWNTDRFRVNQAVRLPDGTTWALGVSIKPRAETAVDYDTLVIFGPDGKIKKSFAPASSLAIPRGSTWKLNSEVKLFSLLDAVYLYDGDNRSITKYDSHSKAPETLLLTKPQGESLSVSGVAICDDGAIFASREVRGADRRLVNLYSLRPSSSGRAQWSIVSNTVNGRFRLLGCRASTLLYEEPGDATIHQVPESSHQSLF